MAVVLLRNQKISKALVFSSLQRTPTLSGLFSLVKSGIVSFT
jgi:hypothetical protein